MSKQSDKYARTRRFKYPDYRDKPYLNQSFSSDENVSDYHDRISPGYDGTIYDQMSQGNQRDHYAALAEQALSRGDYKSALDAFSKSIANYRNIESIKQVGDIFCKAFIEGYQERGYDGHAPEGMVLVKNAISMFVAYVSFGGEASSIEESFNNMASLFYDINDFAAICAKVKAKCRGMDFNNFINYFFKRGL